MRVGLGFDAHAFEEGRPLVLGGVSIPGHAGLAGHSDADVLSHVVGDAVLGASKLGDLGAMFPANDRWRDASSLDILREIAGALKRAGYDVVNVDATVIAQQPKLSPHASRMESNIEEALGVAEGVVSVKATSTDHLGFTGRGEGIAALAVALVQPLV